MCEITIDILDAVSAFVLIHVVCVSSYSDSLDIASYCLVRLSDLCIDPFPDCFIFASYVGLVVDVCLFFCSLM